MLKRKKFKPSITRVILNPEQAVLQCECWKGSYMTVASTTWLGLCAAYNSKSYADACNMALSDASS